MRERRGREREKKGGEEVKHLRDATLLGRLRKRLGERNREEDERGWESEVGE